MFLLLHYVPHPVYITFYDRGVNHETMKESPEDRSGTYALSLFIKLIVLVTGLRHRPCAEVPKLSPEHGRKHEDPPFEG